LEYKAKEKCEPHPTKNIEIAINCMYIGVGITLFIDRQNLGILYKFRR